MPKLRKGNKMSKEYALELLECYEHPEELSRNRDEWINMLSHGDQTDCDIMELVAERDALINKLDESIPIQIRTAKWVTEKNDLIIKLRKQLKFAVGVLQYKSENGDGEATSALQEIEKIK